jgi:hypothetical protein
MSFLSWFMRWLRALWDLIRRLWERIFGTSGGGGTIPDDKCCHLARTDRECNWVGSKSQFTCPEGNYRQWWYCCEGTQQIACGECTVSQSTCWTGPWACSIWWYTGQSC